MISDDMARTYRFFELLYPDEGRVRHVAAICAISG
jgi:hypothetical protein